MIANREGFGELLAEGAFRGSMRTGIGQDITMTVKGVKYPPVKKPEMLKYQEDIKSVGDSSTQCTRGIERAYWVVIWWRVERMSWSFDVKPVSC